MSDHLEDREYDFGRVDGDLVEESFEVDYGIAACEVGHCTDHEMIDAEVLGHLCNGCSLHLGCLCTEGCVQPSAFDVGLKELVPRRYRSENDLGLLPQNRGEPDVGKPSANPIEKIVGGSIAKVLGGVEEGYVPRLVDPEPLRFQDPCVVVQNVLGHHDVSDVEGIVDRSCDASEDHDTRLEVIEGERRHHRGVHLPDPGSGDDDLSGIEHADVELTTTEHDRLTVGHPFPEQSQLTNKSTHDEDGLFHAP